MRTAAVISKAHQLTFESKFITEINQNVTQEKVKDLFNSCGYGEVLVPLNYFLDRMEQVDVTAIHYMDGKQKSDLLNTIHITYLLLLAQEQYERDHQKLENIKHYSKKRIQCEQLLDNLQQRHQRPYSSSPKVASLTKNIIGSMSAFNEKRLYWIWASSLINTILSFIPVDFHHVQNAFNVMRALPFYTGVISWALYYARFLVHFSLLLKNTIKGPWLTNDDKKSRWWTLSVYERFKRQWNERKFSLLNDSIWATGNLICFFWLVGQGTLGHLGSVLTIALLAFDVAASIWGYIEQRSEHKEEIKCFDETIGNSNDPHLSSALFQAKKDCELDWKYKQYELCTNVAYATGLIVAFSLMTLPFLSLSIPALFALSIAGTVLCFALTAARSVIYGIIDIQKEPTIHKKIQLAHSTLISVLTPAVILASLLFLPVGPSLILLGCCAVLALVSGLVINHQKQPNSTKLYSDTQLAFFPKSKNIATEKGQIDDFRCDSPWDKELCHK